MPLPPRRFDRPPMRTPRPVVPAAPPVDPISPWVQLRSASFHPFIFQRMIGDADSKARPGDIVTVYDRSGLLFGRGLYNPRSQITLRMLAHGETQIDEAFWRTRLRLALDLRERMRINEVTDAYRLVHAEGDGLSGLIIERYADCLAFEVFSLGMFQRIDLFVKLLSELLPPPTSLDRPGKARGQWGVIVRADGQMESREGFRVPPPGAESPRNVTIREHGIRYRVDLATGHKTGFFCDQRDNRLRLARLCRDATVLDVCCYTGGFGLAARLLGGAREVTCVDLDEEALAVARDNANLNQTRIDFVHADAFMYMRQLRENGRRFEVVVLDPPKLATSREEFDEALKKYYDLNSLALGVVAPGGLLLTCSCSGLVGPETFVETIRRAARRAGRSVQVFDQTGAGADHPMLLTCPESSYLKAVWARVL